MLQGARAAGVRDDADGGVGGHWHGGVAYVVVEEEQGGDIAAVCRRYIGQGAGLLHA